MKTVYLISCVSRKCESPLPAEQLYCSDLFKKEREYVLRNMHDGDEWYILSAKHGLLHPKTVIGPYNETLNSMGKDERRIWADRVLTALRQVLDSGDFVIFLAGRKYREFLEPSVRNLGCSVSAPLARMPIGKQLQWLGNKVQA